MTTAVLLGGAGVVTAGRGKGKGAGGGGRGFITTTATELLDGAFEVTGEVDDPDWNPTEIAPSCQGNGEPQAHAPYDTTEGAWIFFPADRNVNVGNAYEVVTHTEGCGDVGDGREWIRVVTKPA